MRRLISAVFIAVLFVSCVNEQLESQSPEFTEVDSVNEDQIVKGQCVVLFNDEVTTQIEKSLELGVMRTKSAGIDDMLEQLGVSSMERLFPHGGEFEPRARRDGLHRWYVLTYSDSVPYTKADRGLADLPGVEIVEPVTKIRNHQFTDPLYSELWGLDNASYPEYDINVLPVWRDYTTGNPDVIVAVVDNGVQVDHPDLAANCLKTGHYNAVDQSSSIYPADHGTHVAGIIAAVGNNDEGIVGVAGGDQAAGNAGVKIMSCQIFKETVNGTESDAVASSRAIYYAANNGAVICQNSWGYVYDYNDDGQITGDELDVALAATINEYDKKAVDYFIANAGCDNRGNQLPNSPMKGGLVVFAAGNYNISNGAPAGYEPVIAVGSVTYQGVKSSFSNYGPWVDIAAPGTDIMSTVTNSDYAKLSGTSMACPFVSGVAALVLSYCGGPGFTADMLKEKILKGANKDLIPASFGVGSMLDALGAITYGDDLPPAKVTDLSVSARANTMDLSWTATSDEDGKSAYGYLVLYSKDQAKIQAANQSNYRNVEIAVCTPDVSAGEKVDFTVKGLEFNADYYVKVIAFSYGRNYAEASEIQAFKTTSNNAPVIEAKNEGPYSISPSETLEIAFIINDPDDHDIEVNMTCNAVHTFTQSLASDTYIFKVAGKDVVMGTHQAKITVKDQYGLETEETFVFEVRENSAPVKLKEIDDILLSSKGKELIIDMSEYVTDADGEQLNYDIIVSNDKVVHVTSRKDQLYVTAIAYGLVDVKITARDIRNEKVEFEFKVLVKNSSEPVSIYPNPVSDYVNVGTMEEASTLVQIYNSAGQLLYEENLTVSGINPAQIDMRAYAPGIYYMYVTYGGKEYKETIVKI